MQEADLGDGEGEFLVTGVADVACCFATDGDYSGRWEGRGALGTGGDKCTRSCQYGRMMGKDVEGEKDMGKRGVT